MNSTDISPSLSQKAQEDTPAPEQGSQLTRKASLNAIAALIDYGARSGVAFFINPILLSGLGDVLFGVWQILVRMISYLSVVDGRPQQALKWVVANKQYSDDGASQRRDVGSAVAVWFIFAPVLITGGLLLVWFVPLILQLPTDLHFLVRVVTAILVLNFLIAGLVNIPEFVIRGMNLGYKRMGLAAGVVIAGGLLTVVVIRIGWGLLGVASVQVLTTLLAGLLYWRVAKHNVPWFGVARPTRVEVRRFFSFSSWLFGAIIINRLLFASDVVILGIAASATAVTVYTLTNFPPQVALSVATMFQGATLPGIGGLIGRAEWARVQSVRAKMIAGTWLLTTAMGVTILLWNRAFLQLWVGVDYYAGPLVTLLIVLLTLQTAIQRIDDNIIDISLNVRAKVFIGSIAALVSLVLAGLLARQMGITGLLIGFLLGRVVLTVAYPILVGRLLQMPFMSQIYAALRPFIVSLVLLSISYYGAIYVEARNWVELVGGMIITGGVALTITWFTGLTGQIRQQLWDHLAILKSFRSRRLFSDS
jgi:O-antigen/teichoic acid export membrane protein